MEGNFHVGPEENVAGYPIWYIYQGSTKIAFAIQSPLGNKVESIKGYEAWLPLGYNLICHEKQNILWTKVD